MAVDNDGWGKITPKKKGGPVQLAVHILIETNDQRGERKLAVQRCVKRKGKSARKENGIYPGHDQKEAAGFRLGRIKKAGPIYEAKQ